MRFPSQTFVVLTDTEGDVRVPLMGEGGYIFLVIVLHVDL